VCTEKNFVSLLESGFSIPKLIKILGKYNHKLLKAQDKVILFYKINLWGKNKNKINKIIIYLTKD